MLSNFFEIQFCDSCERFSLTIAYYYSSIRGGFENTDTTQTHLAYTQFWRALWYSDFQLSFALLPVLFLSALMGVLCCTISSTACIWITKKQKLQQIAYVTYFVQRCLSSANISIKTGSLSHTRYFFWYCFDVSTGVHLHYLSSKGKLCVCGSLYSMLHNMVSLILWFFQSSIITEQSRFTLYIFFAQVIHITWIIGSCAYFNFSYCVWIGYTSDPFWTRISTQSSTYFECTPLVKSRMEHFSMYFSITFVMEFRHTSLA